MNGLTNGAEITFIFYYTLPSLKKVYFAFKWGEEQGRKCSHKCDQISTHGHNYNFKGKKK